MLGWLLLVGAAWTAFVWITRLVNIAGEDRSASFIAVHVVIAAISLALAIPVAIVGWRMRGMPRSD